MFTTHDLSTLTLTIICSWWGKVTQNQCPNLVEGSISLVNIHWILVGAFQELTYATDEFLLYKRKGALYL